MRALIVVDMQNDFMPGGALAVAGGDLLVPKINKLMAEYPLVVATQDWHPKDHHSFASVWGMKPLQTKTMIWGEQTLWPDHCVAGTHGADFHKDLDQRPLQAIFRKGADQVESYSGFENAMSRRSGLSEFLWSRNVQSVDVVGLALDYCVKETALHASRRGFRTRVVLDCTELVSPASRGAVLDALQLEKVLTA